MKYKYKKDGHNPPHSNHRLTAISHRIAENGYGSLSESDINFISYEIENNNLSREELEEWMKK